MRIFVGSLLLLLVVHTCFSTAKVVKKGKHASHHHKTKRAYLDDKDQKCVDHSYCIKYSPMDCQSAFLKNNCKNLCGLCGAPDVVKLPMVVYYNKQKAAANKRAARSAHAEQPAYHPTITQKLFDYTGGITDWQFNFVKKHPIQMDWSKPQPFAPAADAATNQQAPAADQAAAPAVNQAAPAVAPTAVVAPSAAVAAAAPVAAVAPAATQPAAYQATQNTFQPQTATPQQDTVNQQTTAATQANNDVTVVKFPNSALEQAKKGKDVYVALYDEKKKEATQTTPQATTQQNDAQMQSFNYKPVKVPCPNGLECNYDGPNAPITNHTFMVYCDDKYPQCGVLSSSCNESWLQVYCPKRCNLCRPPVDDQQYKPMTLDQTQSDAATNDQSAQVGNKVYPTKVSQLAEDSPKMESELVAPEPGAQAERARYTLHVTPKLLNGVPQTQEILIMPPNAKPGSNVKPLVVLKQKVTKPMVENIEIDVPPKGTSYSDEPKVEVIEGKNHETLQVQGGQADLSKAEADLNAQQTADALPTETTPAAQTTQAYQAAPVADAVPAASVAPAVAPAAYPAAAPTAAPAAATPVADPAAAAPVAAPAAAAPVETAQPTQDTQAQYNQNTQTYQDNQAQAPQAAQAPAAQAEPAQSYQTAQAQATQDQAAQTQATQAYASPQAPAATPTVATPRVEPAATQASAYPQQQTTESYTAQQCTDDSRCVSYTKDMCSQNWLQGNCRKKCNLC